MDRIQTIQTLLAKSPNDVFLHYSLAMEYVAAERLDEAVAAFETCITLDGGYLPAYVEAGKSLRSAGRLDEAREMFQRAMELAQDKGEHHTADYVRQQLEGLR